MQTALARTRQIAMAAVAATLLAGCYTYPTYRPVAVARLTPEQRAAIAGNTQLSQADRDRLVQDNTQVVTQDQGGPVYGTPTPAYTYAAPYYADPYYYGYPYYYGGLYPFYPSIGLSFGFGGRFHGGGFRGGFRGHR
jgi:hypothetical protein